MSYRGHTISPLIREQRGTAWQERDQKCMGGCSKSSTLSVGMYSACSFLSLLIIKTFTVSLPSCLLLVPGCTLYEFSTTAFSLGLPFSNPIWKKANNLQAFEIGMEYITGSGSVSTDSFLLASLLQFALLIIESIDFKKISVSYKLNCWR